MNHSSSGTHRVPNAANPGRVGVVLLVAALLAIALDNSPFAWLYAHFLETPFLIRLGTMGLEKPLVLWINDGLMATFFLLVGIEIKRELLMGQFQDLRRAILPVIGALGGMMIPAVLYALRNFGDSSTLSGWAIPCATDIAFALGVLSLAGPGVPASVRLFLTAIAVIDDLGAIVIIAIFYTTTLAPVALWAALICLCVLFALNRFGVTALTPFMLVGLVLWVAVLESGVHATLAGVAIAFAIPLRATDVHGESPALWLEHALQPWVNNFVLPLFAFANAGLPLLNVPIASLIDPIPSGIMLGLVLGKPLGILGAVWLAIRLGIGKPIEGATQRHMIGIGLLGGVGFTMSLFIGSLAFRDPEQISSVRLGVLAASLLAGIAGYLVLRSESRRSATAVSQALDSK